MLCNPAPSHLQNSTRIYSKCHKVQKKRPVREKEPPFFLSNKRSDSLTKHVQADFLSFLSCLVLCDASVISFIHFLDIFYYQFWTILVQAVLITRFKDNVVTEGGGKKGKRQSSYHIHWVIQHEGPTDTISWFYYRKRPVTQQKLGDQKRCLVPSASDNISSISTAFVCLCFPRLYICFSFLGGHMPFWWQCVSYFILLFRGNALNHENQNFAGG